MTQNPDKKLTFYNTVQNFDFKSLNLIFYELFSWHKQSSIAFGHSIISVISFLLQCGDSVRAPLIPTADTLKTLNSLPFQSTEAKNCYQTLKTIFKKGTSV